MAKPKFIAFDLDYTLWPFWVDTHVTAPFKLEGGKVIDAHGQHVKAYPHSTQILEKLHSDGYIVALASRHLKIHDAAVFRFSGEIEDDGNTPKTCRQKLDAALNRPCTQGLVVTLIFADLLIITVLLLIDLKVIQMPPGDNQSNYKSAKNNDDDTLKLVEQIFHDVQLAVISVFLLEILLRIVAQAVDMLDDRWQIFDCLVVLVTFALYVSLTVVVKGKTFTYPSGYVIALRLWRIPRIYRVVVWPYRSRVTGEAIAHRKTIKFAEENLHAAQQKLDQQQAEIEYLKEQLRKTYAARMNSHPLSEVEATITDENFHHDAITPTLLPDAPPPHSDQDGMRLHLYAPNGTIFASHTPRSSLSSNIFPVISLPGTPQSISSSRLTDPPDGARERYPDVVEDTQSADTISHDGCHGDVSVTGRAASDPNLFCSTDECVYTYKDKHKSSRSDDGIQSSETNVGINSVGTHRRVTRDNAARRHSDTMVTSSEVATSEDGENAKEEDEREEDMFPTDVTLSDDVTPVDDTTDRDSERLISDSAIPDADYLGATYVNTAFEPLPPLPSLPPPSPAPTGAEEEQEILRIAQVPFHLVDSCNETFLEDGIPMTSL